MLINSFLLLSLLLGASSSFRLNLEESLECLELLPNEKVKELNQFREQ